jgi:hypothetical protein
VPPVNPASQFGRPATGPYTPTQPGTGPYSPEGTGPRSAPDYQVPAPPPPIDLVSIVLAFIAFLAVLGLIPLWLTVWSVYAPH